MRSLLISWVFVLSFAAVASAQGLRVDQSAERMRVDGSLREWKGARFAQFGSGDDASFRIAFATADGGLYVGAEIADEQLTRQSGVGGAQDALVVTFSMPDVGGVLRSTDVWLHPGKTGKKAAAGIAREGDKPKAEPRIQVVEGPRDDGDGYVLEAFVPWALVPGAEIWEQGRMGVRFEDVDGGSKVESVVRSSDARKPSELPRILLGEGHQDFLGSFLSSQGLTGVEPRFDLRGNVHGDGAPERVVLVDRYLVVYGPKYKKGEAFGYFQLPLGIGGGLKNAVLQDITGDGVDEVLLLVRQKNELGARELWMVVSAQGENPRPIFAIETRKEAKGGFIDSELSLDARGKGPARIRVRVGRASGLDASNFSEARAADAEPILLPWGDVGSRVYQYDGARFAIVEEKKKAAQSVVAASTGTVRESEATDATDEMVTPDLEALLAHFKKENKLKANAQPSKSLVANVFGGARKEHLFVFGTTLLIAAGDLGEGGSYVSYGLPAKTPEDVLYLGTGDVTGDGVREIFVRVKQVLSGADGVHRELAVVLRFDELGRFGRALLADVTRRQGDRVIANRVRTRGGELVILPGEAEGWDAQTYPFTNESIGGADRLLLPWADGPVHYQLEGGRFVAK